MAFIKITAALSLLALASASLEPHYLPPYPGSYTASASSGFASGSAVQRTVDILGFENVNNGDGSYKYSYNTANGISAHESGSPRAQGSEGAAVTAEGGFSYTAPDGQKISLTYTADENGFHPVGSHLPTPPPIPEAILKSIQFNRQHASSSSEGAYNPSHDNGYHY